MSGKIIQLFIVGIEDKSRILDIHENASIEELFAAVAEKTGLDRDAIHITYTTKELQTKKDGKVMYLKDYEMKNGSRITALVRLHGGSDESEESKRLANGAVLTDLPDMLHMDDDPTEKRALMSCGHAIGPNSLVQFCRSLIDVGKYELKCPSINPPCGKRWEYTEIRKIVVLSEKEETYFETKLSENFLRRSMGMQECPKCRTFCMRRDKKICVVCPICTKKGGRTYQFCWYCSQTWSSSNYIVCGNPDCDGKDPRLKMLKKTVTKQIGLVKDCPAARACPKCGFVVEHLDKCKHIECICGQEFCFICLKVRIDGKYQCGSWNTPCIVAPIQEEIPG